MDEIDTWSILLNKTYFIKPFGNLLRDFCFGIFFNLTPGKLLRSSNVCLEKPRKRMRISWTHLLVMVQHQPTYISMACFLILRKRANRMVFTIKWKGVSIGYYAHENSTIKLITKKSMGLCNKLLMTDGKKRVSAYSSAGSTWRRLKCTLSITISSGKLF